MENCKTFLIQCNVFFLFFHGFSSLVSEAQLLPIVDNQGGNNGGLDTYIVHVQRPAGLELLRSDEELRRWHESFLPNTTLDSGRPRLIYSYSDAISGFAARLTAEEVRTMEAMEGFVYARPDKVRQIQTTYTPEFLGLSQWNGTWKKTSWGEGVVIGVLDTGIFPTHPSFSDDGMAHPPKKFKGSCNKKSAVTCNLKIVGARAFAGRKKDKSAVDHDGHGTHVASIAAGNFVFDADVLGMAAGTASGMAPRAHLSIYKVCFADGCRDSNILAGIDRAIKDKVDIITMSIGGLSLQRYTHDSVAQGALAALRHQIVAVASAGNSGPENRTLSHDAPWVTTVGACTTDRRIMATVKLGDGTELVGESAYQPSSFNSSAMYPLVFPGAEGFEASHCQNGSLDFINVLGKIVVCEAGDTSNIEKGMVVYKAGGVAMIIINEPRGGYTTFAEAHVLPASQVSYEDGQKLLEYCGCKADMLMDGQKPHLRYEDGLIRLHMDSPTATILFNDTVFGQMPAPAVASFSSRGPGEMNGGILKPDVLAPGVNILGAWPFKVGPFKNVEPYESRELDLTFNFLSGTSMAAPHVAGIMALIKKKHPKWSPSAIQSAIITSAKDFDLQGQLIVDECTNTTATIFAAGAGVVNAAGAVDPGLVYEIDPKNYTGYLCGLNYTDKEVSALVGRKVRCCKVKHIPAEELNYPSISISLARESREEIIIKRTVKNVGDADEDFRANITAPPGVSVELSVYQLRFVKRCQEESFQIKIRVNSTKPTDFVSEGKLEWVSDKHNVRCPMAVHWT